MLSIHELYYCGELRAVIIIHDKTSTITAGVRLKRYDDAIDALPAEHGLVRYQEGPRQSHSK